MIAERGVTLQVFDDVTGEDVYIQSNQIESVEIVQVCKKITSEIPNDYCTIILKNATELLYLFKRQKQVLIHHNGELHAIMYVSIPKKSGKNNLTIYCENLFFILDKKNSSYYNYYDNADLYEGLSSFLSSLNIPFEINDNLKGKNIYGLMLGGNAKENIIDICFGNNVVVSESKGKLVFKIVDDSFLAKDVSQQRILDNVTEEQKDEEIKSVVCEYNDAILEDSFKSVAFLRRTSSNLGSYMYQRALPEAIDFDISTKTVTVRRMGKMLLTGHTFLEIVPKPARFSGEILQSKIPYKVLERTEDTYIYQFTSNNISEYENLNDPTFGIMLDDVYWLDDNSGITVQEKMLSNEDVPYGDTKKIQRTNFVWGTNVDDVLLRVNNYEARTETIRCRIVEGKHIQEGEAYRYGEVKYGAIKYGQLKPSVITYDEPIYAGDIINIDLGDGYGLQKKFVEQIKYNLNGNIIIKDCILK